MPHPYAALVWGRVLYFDTWDPDLVTRFYLEESERLDANGDLVAPPEPQCAAPSAAPSGSGAGSPEASGAGSPAASGAGASAAPSAPAASSSPAPSAAAS
jgi:hypothetical protein